MCSYSRSLTYKLLNNEIVITPVYIPYIKQMSCVALPLFGLPPVCPRVHSLGYVGDA